jgi:hypothetical protein
MVSSCRPSHPGAVAKAGHGARRVAGPTHLTCRAVARILIVGGGCRGRRLASALAEEERGAHAVRITTRTETGRAAIEEAGAECWIGTPARLATLRGALENVTVVCWLLGAIEGSEEEIRVLHSTRLEFFLGQAIDTTMRGFVYEVPADAALADDRSSGGGAGAPLVPAETIAAGERIVQSAGERNAIPVAFLRADLKSSDVWLEQARMIVGTLLGEPC